MFPRKVGSTLHAMTAVVHILNMHVLIITEMQIVLQRRIATEGPSFARRRDISLFSKLKSIFPMASLITKIFS